MILGNVPSLQPMLMVRSETLNRIDRLGLRVVREGVALVVVVERGC